ncbi:phosphoglucosamine mutase [Candidatus Aerophobetes bacterium]|nr:phosphoglucosamine mutase [Candidatus Aerophobetes bacterium]
MKTDSTLIISPSGVRGVVGKGLSPDIVAKLACAFGKMMGEKILVGYDTRTSNDMFKYAVFSALLSVGCNVVDLGICPTPSLQLMIKEMGANGGIVITGSHNPPEWNALKFVRGDGLFLFPEEGKNLIDIYREDTVKLSPWDRLGKLSKDNSAIPRHIKKVIQLVDCEKIKVKRFKVVVDACNGAGAFATPLLLEKLGCEVVKLNCEAKGNFAHLPEPVPHNLQDLSRIVKEVGADIGFAQDADADRLALVSERGEALSEEYTLMLACNFVLQNKKGLVVTNVSTSRAIDDIAAKFSCPVKRTPVGDIHVSRCMREKGAVIGGEGNGGVIFPPLNYARDGIMAAALILNHLANENISLSSLVDSLPRYYMLKQKIKNLRVDFEKLKQSLRSDFSSHELDFTDGVKILLPEGWIHIRASGTEPVLRVIAEAKDKKTAENLSRLALDKIFSFRK